MWPYHTHTVDVELPNCASCPLHNANKRLFSTEINVHGGQIALVELRMATLQ